MKSLCSRPRPSPSIGDSDLDMMAGRQEPSAVLPQLQQDAEKNKPRDVWGPELEFRFCEVLIPACSRSESIFSGDFLDSFLFEPTPRKADVLLQLTREVVCSNRVPGSYPSSTIVI